MHNLSVNSQVSQLIVLGRGKTESEYKLSIASYDRALAAERFCFENPGVETVVFSGGHSSQAVQGEGVWSFSEAALMAEVIQLPDDVEVILEEESVSTLENILNSSSFIDVERPTGILAHRAQLRRALFIAQKLFLANTVVGIDADSLGARPESVQSNTAEKAQMYWTRHLLSGVEEGDMVTIRNRSDTENHIKRIVGSQLRKFCELTRLPMPPQYN